MASLRSLLTSQFVEFEIVVINDGSKDGTMAVLEQAFGLVKVGRVPRSNLPTQLVRGVYTSSVEPRVVVIDKVNGGKADALNAGINHANYPLFCAIDGDTMLDAGALSRLVWEFQAAPETVAVGGIVRIVNGSSFDDGCLVKVRTPRNLLANLRIIEYLRAFLGGRIGWSKSGMLMIISGAFGLFRRDVCVEAGGYDPTTVGEDAEFVLRLHRHQRERGEPCRVTFFPDPICWTECPEDLRTLVRQRDRWQRGLIEMIARHRKMLFRPSFGRIGCVAMPYFLVFELLGPTIECIGYALFALAVALGVIPIQFALAFLAIALTYGWFSASRPTPFWPARRRSGPPRCRPHLAGLGREGQLPGEGQLPAASKSSRSARSRVRPAARFISFRSSIEQTATATPRISASVARERRSA